MTEEEIKRAIDKVIQRCEDYMNGYKAAGLRAILQREHIYTEEQQDEVIIYCARRGFTNCIDPIIACRSYPDFKPEFPNWQVCYWGPDQLKSRLQSLHSSPDESFDEGDIKK